MITTSKPRKRTNKEWIDVKAAPYYQECIDICRPSVQALCFNNDFLLKHHGVKFVDQLRQLASNGIVLNRKYYEAMRRGQEANPKIMWLSFICSYWRSTFGYSFTLSDLLQPGYAAKINQVAA